MAEVIWSDSAIQDLNDIGEYISKDSEKYAEITVSQLFSSTDILEDHPKAGKVVAEFEIESKLEVKLKRKLKLRLRVKPKLKLKPKLKPKPTLKLKPKPKLKLSRN